MKTFNGGILKGVSLTLALLLFTSVLSPVSLMAGVEAEREMLPATGEITAATEDWDELSQLLTELTGVYAEPSPISNTIGTCPDGPLMGNGTVYAFMGGNKETQNIYISRSDMWEDLVDGRFQDSKQYTTFGGITIQLQNGVGEYDKVQDFRYEQDMLRAEVRADSEKGFSTKSWLSAKENLLVTEITNNAEQALPLEVSAWTTNKKISSQIKGDVMCASKSGVSTKPNWSVNVTLASKVIGADTVSAEKTTEGKCVSKFSLAIGESVTVVSAIEGGKDSSTNVDDAVAKTKSRLTKTALQKSHEAHIAWWEEYWKKSSIRLHDESFERLYYGSLYELGCATSSASENNAELPPGLFPWTAATKTNWQGDYTANTDVTRAIHPLVQANRLEGLDNYISMLTSYWPEAQRRAADKVELNRLIVGTGHPEFTQGIRGVLFPTHLGPWGTSTEEYNGPNTYWRQPSNASAVIMPMVRMWQYTRDDAFLADKLYPWLKDVADFWEDYVVLEDGKYVVYGSTHETVSSDGSGKNSIFDLMAVHYILNNAIDAANSLGRDATSVSSWQNILDNLSDYPFATDADGFEYFVEKEGIDWVRDVSQTNPVPIQGVYYFDSVGYASLPEQRDRVINYIEKFFLRSSHRGFNAMLRVGYPADKLISKARSLINEPVEEWSGLRNNNTVGDIGSAAWAGVFQELLLQSNEDFLHLFPSWPTDKSASFKTLRAKGGFLVSASQNEHGAISDVTIKSEVKTSCSVLNHRKGTTLIVKKDGSPVATTTSNNALGDVYHFATEANGVYTLEYEGEIQELITLNRNSIKLDAKKTAVLTAKTESQKTVVWSSQDPKIATVEQNGTITGIKGGRVEIIATLEGTKSTASCYVTVKNIATASPTISPKGGIIEEPINVTLDCDTEGAEIYYTTDGSSPSNFATANKYEDSFVVFEKSTVKACAIKKEIGYGVSAITSADFIEIADAKPVTDKIEAEAFDDSFDVVNEGKLVGYFKDGGWMQYEGLYFGTTLKLYKMKAYLSGAGNQNGSVLEFYLDKKPNKIGEIVFKSVGSWNDFSVHEAVLSAPIIGGHSLYVEGRNAKDFVCNVDWFQLEELSELTKLLNAEVATMLGVAPIMPKTTKGEFTSEYTADVEVLWDSIPEAKYQSEGVFEVEGTVRGTSLKATCQVVVKESVPVTGVELNKSTLDLEIGGVETMVATVLPENASNKSIIWSSSDNNVAVVSKDGVVTALAAGTTIISVKTVSGEFTQNCTVTVVAPSNNVAIKKAVTAISQHEGYGPDRAVSGTWAYDYEGWTSANTSWEQVPERWLKIDLGEEYDIARWVIRHGGHRNQETDDPIGDPEDAINWGDYHLQVSPDGESDWQTVDSKVDNKNNTTDRTLGDAVSGRYFRIFMEFPMFQPGAGWEWPSGFARINQLELHTLDSALSEVTVKSVAAIDNLIVDFGTSFEGLGLPSFADVELSGGTRANLPVTWQEGSYDGNIADTHTLNGDIVLPENITNPDSLGASIQVIVSEEIPPVDKSALQSLYDQNKDKNQSDYTVESWGPFTAALQAAKALLDLEAPTEIELANAANALQIAISGLVLADKTTAVSGVALQPQTLVLNTGDSSMIIATVSPDNATNKAVTWASSNPAVATVDANGAVSAVSAGTATITVTTQDGGKTATSTITVNKAVAPVIAVESVTLGKTTLTLVNGTSETLVATVSPADAANKAITWSSSDNAIAAVDANGVVTAKKAGKATITVTTKDGGKSASCTVTVTPIKVAEVALNMLSKDLKVKQSVQLKATVTPANAENKAVTWKSSNTKVATVSKTGKVKAVKNGTAVITATADGKTAKVKIRISSKYITVTSVKLSSKKLALNVKASATLKATVNPAKASNKKVVWSSSNPAVASVSSGGKVMAKSVGKAVITVTTQEGGHSAKCTVTIKDAVTKLGLNKTKVTMKKNAVLQLRATITPTTAAGTTLTWTSSNSKVASVSASGRVKALKAGKTTITVTAGNKKTSCVITVR